MHWLVLEFFRGSVWQGSPQPTGVASPDARYQPSRSSVADLMFFHLPTVISCGWRLKANQ
jgi:hypothetical protein